ncbi:MAG: hypothetical protein ACR2NO_05650 [Chloroflexota bacterium]
MSLQQTVVLGRVRALVQECTGMERVYGVSESDENAMPEAAVQFPCAFVLPGATTEYILSSGQHRHTYQVLVQILNQPGMSTGQAYAVLAPYVDRVIEKFAGNVTLGTRANICVFEGSSGMRLFESGDVSIPGIEITLRTSEQAAATPAIGA